MAATSFRIAPGRFAGADSALMAALSLREGLGATASQWRLVSAGTNTGLRLLTVSHDNYSAIAELNAKIQERNEGGAGPGARAVQSGTMELVNQTTSTLVEA